MSRSRLVDEWWMDAAIDKALEGKGLGEWPFGAVVVRPDRVGYGEALGHAFSTERVTGDPMGHAEIHAVQDAWRESGDLTGATLYTTHEPCVLCSGAIRQARLGRVVIGTERAQLPGLFRPLAIGFRELMADVREPIEVQIVGAQTWARCRDLFAGVVAPAA